MSAHGLAEGLHGHGVAIRDQVIGWQCSEQALGVVQGSLGSGRVADSGTLDQLIARQPRFREMWREVVKSESPEPVAG